MKKLIILLLAIPLTILTSSIKAAINYDINQTNNKSVDSLNMGAPKAPESNVSTQIANDTNIATEALQTAKSEPEWLVSTSPNGNVTVDEINTALSTYKNMGMTKLSAAYLVGNFITESFLKPCSQPGDGGLALGLAQWHPGRRQDMPCDYVEQLKWAVDVEMQRDSPASRSTLFDPNASVEQIQQALKNWERWGVLGARWVYAANIYSQIQ